MRTFTIYLLVALGLAVGSDRGRSDEQTDEPARAAVRKGLEFLDADTFKWREQRTCAACHHGPMFVWAANVASTHGYKVSQTNVAEITRWLTADYESRVFPRATAAESSSTKFSLAAVFAAHGIQAATTQDAVGQAGERRALGHLVASQNDDGSWTSPAGRPPFFGSDATVTRLSRLAILTADQAGRANDEARRAAVRAEKWLATQNEKANHQSLGLDLWAATMQNATHRDNAHIAKLVTALRGQQRADGGWSQGAELESDAFATGQALFGLANSDVPAKYEQVQRAVEFLVRTQQADATWKMKSQIDPTTGRAARNLNPITYAGTAWAVIGIANFVDEPRASVVERPISNRP
jgi:hypothetical protein